MVAQLIVGVGAEVDMQLAIYIDKILTGAKPGDLPITKLIAARIVGDASWHPIAANWPDWCVHRR
jgi:hypothetical protein